MFLWSVSLFFIGVGLIDSKSVKSGVFDNVTVYLQGLDKAKTEDVVFIEYDDDLGKYINDKPCEIVIIRNQIIPKLEANSVSNLPKVQNLSMTNNGIREIQRGTFKNLPNLRVLNLSHNAIEEVSNGVFNNLSVEELYLDYNKISRIGYKGFSNLHVTNLFLNHNRISRWSKDWFADSSVLVLNMGFNLIEELPPNCFYLMSKDVNMSVIFSNNQLRKIGDNVFNGIDSYKSVFLDGNLIEHLDAGAFNGVNYVNVLNLNNNSISEIDVNLLKTIRVDVLMLEDNKLRCISTDIFQMEELDIDGNPITCFCVKTWLDWRDRHSNPSIYHITNLEEECI
ncbi:LRR 8 domain containing protein [Asbolus verrucosus]|uniref:LRR 8 domain containing protein n=1 Tax=Asbolus verrucosus TaxID=1661398 RepID=A0A482W0H0_ASBVE|nr:LRR 8 domain containing protein [Asbolus verrucosus]